MGWGTISEVLDGSGELCRGPGWIGGPSRRTGTGRELLESPGTGWGNHRGGPGWVVGLSRRFGTGLGTLREVLYGLGGILPRSGTGWGTLSEDRDGLEDLRKSPVRVGVSLEEVRDESGDP